jgi:hypothetical protein
MNGKSLGEKFREQKKTNGITYFKLLLVPLLIFPLYFPLNAILGASEYYLDYVVLTITLEISYLPASIIWIKYLSTSPNRLRKFGIVSAVAAIPQIYVLYLMFVVWPLILSYISIVILFELLFYAAHYLLGGLPGNGISFWISVFLILGLAGFFFSFSTVAGDLIGVSVEIIGAFIGVFAALSLGEVVKEVHNLHEERILKELILQELVEVEEKLKNAASSQIPIPVWSSALSGGSILKLDSDFRKKTTRAHEQIHYFNLNPISTDLRKNALEAIGCVID